MNRILLLNGSPKNKDSASEKYLEILYRHLDQNYYIEEEMMIYKESIVKKINDADIIVIASPLYADSFPSHVITFFSKISDANLSDKLLYVIMNCGFLEGIHNIVAFKIIKNYCKCHGIKYMGGLGIGGGPVGYRKTWYNLSIYSGIKKMARYINYQNYFSEKYVGPLIPRPIYIWIANIRWSHAIKSFKN